jgi:hypothetical protein
VEGMWREVVVSRFTIGGTKEAAESLSQDTRYPGRDSNRHLSDCKSEALLQLQVTRVLSGEAAEALVDFSLCLSASGVFLSATWHSSAQRGTAKECCGLSSVKAFNCQVMEI